MPDDVSDVWTLLERVGLRRPAAGPEAIGSLDTLANPPATDALAALLVSNVEVLAPDLVVVWDGLHNVVLGYAVGLHLAAQVVVLSDDEGLVISATPTRQGQRAVLVSATMPEAASVRMAASYLESQNLMLVGTATLVSRVGGDQTIALAELPAADAESGELARQKPTPHQPRRQDGR